MSIKEEVAKAQQDHLSSLRAQVRDEAKKLAGYLCESRGSHFRTGTEELIAGHAKPSMVWLLRHPNDEPLLTEDYGVSEDGVLVVSHWKPPSVIGWLRDGDRAGKWSSFRELNITQLTERECEFYLHRFQNVRDMDAR